MALKKILQEPAEDQIAMAAIGMLSKKPTNVAGLCLYGSRNGHEGAKRLFQDVMSQKFCHPQRRSAVLINIWVECEIRLAIFGKQPRLKTHRKCDKCVQKKFYWLQKDVQEILAVVLWVNVLALCESKPARYFQGGFTLLYFWKRQVSSQNPVRISWSCTVIVIHTF